MRFFRHLAQILQRWVPVTQLSKALQRNTQAAQALDAVVKEMLES